MQKPDIGIIFEERLSNEDFKSFEDSVKSEGLSLIIESREPSGPMACSEWYILPVVAAFIGKSYFDGFLKEMGKDHYQSLKDNLSTLTNKVMDKPRKEPTLMGTAGKISTNNPFSLSFAIHADTVSRTFAKAIKATGIEYTLTAPSFHELRSLAEREYREQGINTKKLLGHKREAMTEVYNDVRGCDWSKVEAI